MPNAGTYYASVLFTPSSTASYNAVTGTVAVAVSKAAPNVTVWPAATGITYGQKLSVSTLGSGTVTPGGAFAFTAPLTTPSAGSYTAAVTFTPTDSSDYATASGTAQVTVSKATSGHNGMAVSQRHRLWTAVGGFHLERGQRLHQRQFHL